MIVCVRVAVVDLPGGAASEAEDIWARVQAAPLAEDRINLLHANGLRIGVSEARHLLNLAGVLEALAGKELLYAVMPGVTDPPSTLTLRADLPPRTVFAVGRDGLARGTDYPGGDYALGIGCRLDVSDPSRVQLTIVPQIHSGEKMRELVRSAGHLTFRNRQEVTSFSEASVRVTLPVGDALVVGPSRQAGRTSSIGHCFLAGDRDGIPFETMILLIPEVVVTTSR